MHGQLFVIMVIELLIKRLKAIKPRRETMSLKAGIIGLPNVGKSTLFNALTKSTVEAANYPFATVTPNIGVVEVLDERLDKIAEIFKPKKKTYTSFEFFDVAGLVKGASLGEGLGNQFLAVIREADALCQVVRCFEDKDMSNAEEGIDPIRDIEIINLELLLADLQVIENRLHKVERKAKTSDPEALYEQQLLLKFQSTLLDNKILRLQDLNDKEQRIMKAFSLLTLKPIIYVVNLKEEDLGDYQNNQHYQQVKQLAELQGDSCLAVSAKLEDELIRLDDDTRALFMEELNLQESGLSKIAKTTYDALGLATFFTAGDPEVRAWTFVKGMKASQCAGVIHSDFERGFIKAEAYSYEELLTYGSEQKIKENGKLRLEGKDYLVKDGDILFFRFNV
jgi:GTP-binding protein YchF